MINNDTSQPNTMSKFEKHRGRFEAHITLDKEYGPRLRDGLLRWQYSAIDDDPIMGQKPYCYLTSYMTDALELKQDMEDIVDILQTEMNIPVLRTKIERIIYDSKTGVDEITQPVST